MESKPTRPSLRVTFTEGQTKVTSQGDMCVSSEKGTIRFRAQNVKVQSQSRLTMVAKDRLLLPGLGLRAHELSLEPARTLRGAMSQASAHHERARLDVEQGGIDAKEQVAVYERLRSETEQRVARAGHAERQCGQQHVQGGGFKRIVQRGFRLVTERLWLTSTSKTRIDGQQIYLD